MVHVKVVASASFCQLPLLYLPKAYKVCSPTDMPDSVMGVAIGACPE